MLVKKENFIKIDRYSKITDYPQLQEEVFEDDLLFCDAIIIEILKIKEGGLIKYETVIDTFGLIISNFYFYNDLTDEKAFLFSKKTFRQLNDGMFELTMVYFNKEYVFN